MLRPANEPASHCPRQPNTRNRRVRYRQWLLLLSVSSRAWLRPCPRCTLCLVSWDPQLLLVVTHVFFLNGYCASGGSHDLNHSSSSPASAACVAPQFPVTQATCAPIAYAVRYLCCSSFLCFLLAEIRSTGGYHRGHPKAAHYSPLQDVWAVGVNRFLSPLSFPWPSMSSYCRHCTGT